MKNAASTAGKRGRRRRRCGRANAAEDDAEGPRGGGDLYAARHEVTEAWERLQMDVRTRVARQIENL